MSVFLLSLRSWSWSRALVFAWCWIFLCQNLSGGRRCSAGGCVPRIMNALNLKCTRKSSTWIKVADGWRLHTHGVIEDLPITVNGVMTTVNFYVVDIEDTGKNHPVILGRPWLRRSDAVSYWKMGHMSFGSSKEKIPVQPREDPSVEEESSSSLSLYMICPSF